MISNALEKLFGSPARVKLIRLFLNNPDILFIANEIPRKTKLNAASVRKEIALLKNVDMIRSKDESIDEVIKLKNGKIKNNKKKVQGFKLNPLFPFLKPLRNLIVEAMPVDRQKLAKALSSAGQIKLIAFSGIFTQTGESRVDLLLVGDSLHRNQLDKILKDVEVLIGKEISYAIFGTQEFWQRYEMHDRFVRDILDYPHEKAVNKLGV